MWEDSQFLSHVGIVFRGRRLECLEAVCVRDFKLSETKIAEWFVLEKLCCFEEGSF